MFELVPMHLDQANEFVSRYHRHAGRVIGYKFALGASQDGKVVGVAIVGRPISRHMDDGWTLEVNRLCTDGTKNANSFLYAASWRAARSLGYRRLITYTLKSESGASLRAADWKVIGEVRGRSWHCKSRPRVDKHEIADRLLWSSCDPVPQ